MSTSTQSLDNSTIHKALNLLGLEFSESELNELQSRNYISLEGKDLSEIGTVFILATALSSAISGKTKETITFQDLMKAVTESTSFSGIPIYCWNFGLAGKSCLYLTLVAGKPAVSIYSESYKVCTDNP